MITKLRHWLKPEIKVTEKVVEKIKYKTIVKKEKVCTHPKIFFWDPIDRRQKIYLNPLPTDRKSDLREIDISDLITFWDTVKTLVEDQKKFCEVHNWGVGGISYEAGSQTVTSYQIKLDLNDLFIKWMKNAKKF